MRLWARAPAKINLCLFVGPVRADGRHELVTLFESVSLADELLLVTHDGGADEVHCPGVTGSNLVAQALDGLRRRGWDGPAVTVEIEKRIPVAAGMGGGSADAAAALRMAVELAPGRPEEVAALAAALGADVPSQLVPGLAVGTGAGELADPFAPIAPHGVLVLPQAAELSTAEVYREADRLGPGRTSDELAQCYEELVGALAPGATLPGELLVNDLGPAAVSLCPAVGIALADASAAGADTTLVCGSGPTVIGVFWGRDGHEAARTAAAALEPRYPRAAWATPVDADYGMPRIA
jgi:4-diphosphocytidyl-2-C-methyl-D-erythritol kinase